MKRSKMVKYMGDALSQFLPNTDIKKLNLIADCLLTEAEKYGMLPPYENNEDPWGWNEGFIDPPQWDEE